MENIYKYCEIPPNYNEPVFPEILDECWKKVSAEQKMKANLGDRKKMYPAPWCCNLCFVEIFIIVQLFTGSL